MAFRQPEKDRLERFRALDCRLMQRQGVFDTQTSGTYSWFNGENGQRKASIGYEARPDELILSYTADDQPHRYAIPLQRTACNYGGSRLWFACPVVTCRKRVAVLYLKHGIFACRHCQQLNYQSQQLSKDDQHRLRMNRIRERLNWPFTGDVPFIKRITKPKGMHYTTFERLTQEHDRHERRHINVMIGGLNRITGMVGGKQWGLLPEL